MPLNSVPPIPLALLVTFVVAASAFGQLLEPLMGEPEALVALLVGENLPRASGSRRISQSTASRAAAGLMQLGDKAVPALVVALDSKVPLQRLNAAYVLTLIDAPAAQAALLRAARNEDQAVKALAIEALPVYTSSEAHQLAWAALSDPIREVQTAAMMAYMRRLKDKPSTTQRYIAAQKIAELLKVAELRPTAAWVLGHLGSNVAARQLVAALDDARPEVRSVILASLAKLGDKQTTLGIVPCLRDAEVNVRCAAAMTLGELRDLRATPALTAALADSAASVRREAAAALGKTGDWRAGERLWPLLDDAEDDVSRNAVRALGEIGDRRAVPLLIKVLSQPEFRAEPAADALGRLGDPRAIAALGQYLEKHPDSEIAAQALAKIRHPEAVAELARVASTIKSLAARRGLRAIADVGFDFHPPEDVAQWWKENKEHYLRPLPVSP